MRGPYDGLYEGLYDGPRAAGAVRGGAEVAMSVPSRERRVRGPVPVLAPGPAVRLYSRVPIDLQRVRAAPCRP
ncbi:hypothetical protein [Streptomyces sp. NPDC051567]|uniref:hypothetical protein n=1 Tax=Streptomyces sp. NPDC051567 TaxID=3365660 RepID=UPI0037A25D46